MEFLFCFYLHPGYRLAIGNWYFIAVEIRIWVEPLSERVGLDLSQHSFPLPWVPCFIGVPSGMASLWVGTLSSPLLPLYSRAGAVPRGGFFLSFLFSSGVWELDSVPLFSY